VATIEKRLIRKDVRSGVVWIAAIPVVLMIASGFMAML
jgi:hypothetical protein